MMNALYIGDNIAFCKDVVYAALNGKGYIQLIDCIDTSGFNLGTGGKTLDLMEKENILWGISKKINNINSINGEQVDCLIIQAETAFRDNKSLSDSLGLNLVKHVLLTEYPNLRGMKIIALSFFDLHYLVRRNPDNVILLSPYVDLAHRVVDPEALGNQLSRIVATYNREIRYEGEDYYRNLNNYVVILPEEEVEANHHRRNLTGIDSLYNELSKNEEEYRKTFAEDVLQHDKDYVEDIWKLYHKKMAFKSRLLWQVNREEPLSDAEIKAYKDVYKSLDNFSPKDWPMLFEQVINSFKCSLDTVLSIEDKSYWVSFYKRLLPVRQLISKESSDEAERCIMNYARDVSNRYSNGIREFSNSIEYLDYYSRPNKELSFPDLSIVDVYLSLDDEKRDETSGMKRIAQLKKINRLAPVIVCSASRNNEKIRRALKEGADDIFIKDIGGLRYLLLKLYQLSRNATLRKNAGILINYLEDKRKIIPRLVSNDDGLWHLYKQEGVLTVREMKWDERLILVNNIEKSIEKGERAVWEAICNGFIDYKMPAYIKKLTGSDYWNQILASMAMEFKNHTGKKRICFGKIDKTFDDTVLLLKRSKPVRVKVTRREDDLLHVDVVNTDFKGIIEKTQVLQIGYDETQFNTIKKDDFMIACRRKYYDMPDMIDTETLIRMDLLKIDGDER